MIPMKNKVPSKEHTAFRDDMVAMMRKHQHMPPDEMLAVAAYFVGQLLALQDQRRMTPEMGLQVISSNIEAGNAQAIEQALGNPVGGDSRDIMDGRGRRDIFKNPRAK